MNWAAAGRYVYVCVRIQAIEFETGHVVVGKTDKLSDVDSGAERSKSVAVGKWEIWRLGDRVRVLCGEKGKNNLLGTTPGSDS